MEEDTIPEENNHLTFGQSCLSTAAVTSVATLTATLLILCVGNAGRDGKGSFTILHSQVASVYDQVERLYGREREKEELQSPSNHSFRF